MEKMKAGFIGFIPFGAQGDEFYDYVKSYAEIGYKGFEFTGNLLKGDVDANLARVKSYGIEPICGPMIMSATTPSMSFEEAAQGCHKIGAKRLGVYVSQAANHRFGRLDAPVSYDDTMREIEDLEKAAQFFAKEGIDFMFHNHDTELNTTFSGIPILDMMYINTETLKFELDIGWITYGGRNPVDYINRFGSRVSAIHVKDFADGWVVQEPMMGATRKRAMPRFTTPGTGKVKIRECLKAASELGVEWAIVEQDFQYNLTEKETLTAAYLNMKEMGYIE